MGLWRAQRYQRFQHVGLDSFLIPHGSEFFQFHCHGFLQRIFPQDSELTKLYRALPRSQCKANPSP